MTHAKQRSDHKCHWFPIDLKHTSVNGYGAWTNGGRWQWEVLNWNEWWTDNASFKDLSADYLHVETTNHDGCVFRVRCRYSVGNLYRGRLIYDVSIGCRGGKLHWLVRTKPGKKRTAADFGLVTSRNSGAKQ